MTLPCGAWVIVPTVALVITESGLRSHAIRLAHSCREQYGCALTKKSAAIDGCGLGRRNRNEDHRYLISSPAFPVARRGGCLGYGRAPFIRSGPFRLVRQAIFCEGAVRLCRHLHVSRHRAWRNPSKPGAGHLSVQDEPERWRTDPTAPPALDHGSEPILPRSCPGAAPPLLRK